MAVYTAVESTELTSFLANYSLGELQEYSGIVAGVENTNYRLRTAQGEWILTLFESMPRTEIEFVLALMAKLADHSPHYARPETNHQGECLGELAGRPAVLVSCLPGESIEQPSAGQCRQIGLALCQFHQLAATIAQPRMNPRGDDWRVSLADKLRDRLSPDERALLDDELAFQAANRLGNLAQLPVGVIHGDLFRDNALFAAGQLSGIIDLYNSGQDCLLYDLAITANDWCMDRHGELDAARLTAFLSGCAEIRSFTDAEQTAWPIVLRAAALRFWLSRLRLKHFPQQSGLAQSKDPDIYRQLLEKHRQQSPDMSI